MKTTGFNSLNSWGVAAACGFVNLVTQVPLRLAGLLFVAIIDRYDTNRELASWPFTIGLIMRCAPGPLIAYLGEYIGLRNLTILGSILASVGVGICYYAEDILAVIICFGLINGIGVSMANTLMPQILKQHFDSNLANANGIVFASSCLGAVVFSPLFQVLINTYGLSGSFLIISGIMLNGIPVSFLCKAPDSIKSAPASAAEKGKGQYVSVPWVDSGNLDRPLKGSSDNKDSEFCQDYYTKERSDSKTEVSFKNAANNDKRTYAHVSSSDIDKSCEQAPDSKPEDEQVDDDSNPNQKLVESSLKINLTKNRRNSELDQQVEVYVSTTEAIEQESKCQASLKTLSLFKDPLFLVILITHGALAFGANCTYTIMVDVSRDKGIPRSEEIYFVMALPAAELTGYLCLGWVTDLGYVSNSNYIAACLLCYSLGCCDLVWSNGFYTMLAGVFLIGVCAAGVGTAFPGLIYEFIEEKKQAMAIASRLMLFTPLSFCTAPLIGYFRGTLQSYSGLMYLLAAINMACAFLIVVMPCIARLKAKKKLSTRGLS